MNLGPGVGRLTTLGASLTLVALTTAWSASRVVRPTTSVEGKTHDLGTTAPGGHVRHSWLIRNDARRPLKLRTRFTSGRCGFSLWIGEDYAIPPGDSLRVSLTMPTPSQLATAYSGLADVKTDDPEAPSLRFRVFGRTGATIPVVELDGRSTEEARRPLLDAADRR